MGFDDKKQDKVNFADATVKQEKIEFQKLSIEKKDLITSVILIGFSLYLLGTGIQMSFTTMKLSDSPWYGTPGMFAVFIGTALLIFSSVMFASLLKAGVRVGKDTLDIAKHYFVSRDFRRAVVVIGFLAIYIFVLFGNISFVMATFIYLCATMIYFREENFSIWKIVVISAAVVALLYLFFGVLAGIPLP